MNRCLVIFKGASEEELVQLDQSQRTLTKAMDLLLERLRFSEAKPVWGKLLVGILRSALFRSDFDEHQEIYGWWLPQAARLKGKELSKQRAQLLEALLSRNPPVTHFTWLLEKLLSRWCKEEMLDLELELIQEALEALRDSWVKRLPENWQAVCRISDSCKQIATTCQEEKKPQTATLVLACGLRIQSQCFSTKAAEVLHAATTAGNLQGLQTWCRELEQLHWLRRVAFRGFVTEAAWRLWQRLVQKQTEPLPVHVPELDGFAQALCEVRASAVPHLASRADAFLRWFYPALATHVHLKEWQMSPTADCVQRLADSEQAHFDNMQQRLAQTYLQARPKSYHKS